MPNVFYLYMEMAYQFSPPRLLLDVFGIPRGVPGASRTGKRGEQRGGVQSGCVLASHPSSSA